jgi:hypothetical protein
LATVSFSIKIRLYRIAVIYMAVRRNSTWQLVPLVPDSRGSQATGVSAVASLWLTGQLVRPKPRQLGQPGDAARLTRRNVLATFPGFWTLLDVRRPDDAPRTDLARRRSWVSHRRSPTTRCLGATFSLSPGRTRQTCLGAPKPQMLDVRHGGSCALQHLGRRARLGHQRTAIGDPGFHPTLDVHRV